MWLLRSFLVQTLLLISFTGYTQEDNSLNEVSETDTCIAPGKAIIYGKFIQRLGFSSGGFPQYIRIQNVDTKTIYSYCVKPTFKSARENNFRYHILPGRYVIVNYYWVKSVWYGGQVFVEPIYKNIAASKIRGMLLDSKITESDLKQYTFTIEPNTVNYLGTWHFDKEIVSFTNDKTQQDAKDGNRSFFRNINLNEARIVLPE